ncbi:MAG: NifB/NifX family molybdenum-iron cluster-binding protein [Promethearchaeota archaeon]
MRERIVFSSDLPGGLSAPFEFRFGRCPAFTVVDQEDGKIIEVNVVNNQAAGAMGGAGIQAAQLVGNLKPTAIVVGNLGPNASMGISQLNVKVYQVVTNSPITVKDALDLYNAGKLPLMNQSNVSSHYGMGGGRGMGMGGGRGMGMGGGRGMGMGGGRGRQW